MHGCASWREAAHYRNIVVIGFASLCPWRGGARDVGQVNQALAAAGPTCANPSNATVQPCLHQQLSRAPTFFTSTNFWQGFFYLWALTQSG